MSTLEASLLTNTDSKYHRMKQLTTAIQSYFQTKREDTAMLINMHLQSLSVTIDLSIFDPHSNVAPQFFVSLYELMNKMEQRSSFAWNCVDVLTNICRNPAARQALIHTYQFIPSLSRLLSDQLSSEKKIRLLRLMQDLSCGIRISWQIPHLPQLMRTLSEWIGGGDEAITILSIGVLVNLCYKNLPAMYTLLSNVEVKKVIQICASMKGPAIELHTCKLLIFLDYMNGDIPGEVLLKLINVTFDSVITAFGQRDAISLRQTIQFFLDVCKQNSLELLVQKQNYERQIASLVDVISTNHTMDTGDCSLDNRDPECISLVFEFLNCLVQIKITNMVTMYGTLVKVALDWIHTDLVSAQAFLLLRSIAVSIDGNNLEILEPLVQGLPIFLNTIECNSTKDGPQFLEQNLKIAGLFQLLKIMAQVACIRPKIIEELKLASVRQVFGGLQDSDNVAKELDMGNLQAINLYVHGLALVNELAPHDASWMNLQLKLMQNRQTHIILAQCLYQSPKEEKSLILSMSNVPSFPHHQVAEIMSNLQSSFVSEVKHSSTSSIPGQELGFPVLSITQVNKIDCLVSKLSDLIAQKQFSSILTSDIMELYEYKLASMGNAERMAMSSVEAASERCTQLQHRNAQITSELTRSHQLLYHVQQCYEQVSKLKESVEENVDALKNHLEAEKGRLKVHKSQLSVKEDELNECRSELQALKAAQERFVAGKKELEEQNLQLKQYIGKLEENSTKSQKIMQKKEDMLSKITHTVESLNMKVSDLEQSLSQKDSQLQQTKLELKDVTNELNTRKQILETISKFALNSQMSEK